MPKADGPQHAHPPDASASASPNPSKAEATDVKPPAAKTEPDEIAPLHVLEAAHAQDRKETEDLLAGFDRRGRPRASSPNAQRDFVDYYAKKKGEARPAAGRADAPRQKDVATFVLPRKKKAPAWLPWAGIGAAMLLLGGVVAFFATADNTSGGAAASAPSAATTITAATAPSGRLDEAIPPPPPADEAAALVAPTTITATPEEPAPTAPVATTAPAPRPVTTSAPRPTVEPTATATATATPATKPTTEPTPARKPPPRDDFIRDF